jgi:sugar/nucleoside kinase (ribokinase family)
LHHLRAGRYCAYHSRIREELVDSVGARDAFLAVTSPLVAAGGSIHHIGFIGNVTGALKVEIVGHRCSIEKPALIEGITTVTVS